MRVRQVRVAAHDHQIAQRRQLGAEPDRGPMHRGDDRHRQCEHGAEDLTVNPTQLRAQLAVRPDLTQDRDVAPGAEGATRAREYYRARVVVVLEFLPALE